MRLRILTIASLAFYVIFCFIIDGELLFGESGIILGKINEADLNPVQISIYQLSSLIGMEEHLILKSLILVFAFSFFLIIYNKFVVMSSIGMWLVYWIICNSGVGYAYGADYFIIFLLYFNVFLLAIFRNRKDVHRYLILMLQLHLCLVYFFAGLGKIVGTDWWDGNAMWSVFNVHGVDFIRAKVEMFLELTLVLKVLSIGTVLIEILYPFLIFYKRTKKITLFAVISMHVGIAMVMNFYTFGLVMIVMNLVAFGHYLNLKNPFKTGVEKSNDYNPVPA